MSICTVNKLKKLDISICEKKKTAEIYKSQIPRTRKYGILLSMRVDNIQTDKNILKLLEVSCRDGDAHKLLLYTTLELHRDMVSVVILHMTYGILNLHSSDCMFGRTDGWMIYMDDVLRFNGVHSHKHVYTTHALLTLYI
jgi:hypothetical protein